jgi:carbon monoxide dehydrogenase subunit G
VHIQAPAGEILAILLDPAALPEWNPAFSEVSAEGTARVGLPNPIRVRGLLRGELVYDAISEREVAITIRIPGMTEQGTWQLADSPGGTTVTHAFTQSGMLAQLLESATRDVASLRVSRLRERVAHPHAVIS